MLYRKWTVDADSIGNTLESLSLKLFGLLSVFNGHVRKLHQYSIVYGKLSKIFAISNNFEYVKKCRRSILHYDFAPVASCNMGRS